MGSEDGLDAVKAKVGWILTLKLPSNNVVPLVQLQGQIAMRLNLAREVWVHGSL
jgi:hypothetical protein